MFNLQGISLVTPFKNTSQRYGIVDLSGENMLSHEIENKSPIGSIITDYLHHGEDGKDYYYLVNFYLFMN